MEENREVWESGPATYFPNTFDQIVVDAVASVNKGLADGLTRMEVEYPLSSDPSGYKDSSDAFVDANIQFAIRAGKLLSNDGERKVRILLADSAEMERARVKYKPAMDLAGAGVSMGCLTAAKKGVFGSLFGNNDGPNVEEQSDADIFLVINNSAVELPNMRSYVENVAKGRPVVLWCLELDTLRADLGLFGFPGKDLQYDFLSTFKTMFYIRQRKYSKTVTVAPFVVNYNGALFRQYPYGWQVMLKQDSGELACVAERAERYTLTEVKEELLEIVGLNTEEKGSLAEFARKGYKQATWWEEEKDKEKSSEWRY